MMTAKWLRLLALGAVLLFAGVQALPAGVADEQPKKTEQPPKPKGTLRDSGLEDEPSAIDTEKQQQKQQQLQQQQQQQQQRQQQLQQHKEQQQQLQQQQREMQIQPLALPNSYAMNQVPPNQHDKTIENLAAAYYEDSRYKRESDLDPEDFLALLSLYEAERKNQGNWKGYGSDDYEPIDDESNMIGLDEEDPRGAGGWLGSGYPGPLAQQQQQHRYDLSSELAGLGRVQPSRDSAGYYEYMPAQAYDGLVQYDQPQYVAAAQLQQPSYLQQQQQQQQQQRAYYAPEKRFMVSRKRSQNYDSYGSRNGLMPNSRGYPSYQHRVYY